MKRLIFLSLTLCLMLCAYAEQASTRVERQMILKGNELYQKGDYKGARNDYEAALKDNPNSLEATYNLGLANIRLSEAKEGGTDKEREQFKMQGAQYMESVANASKKNPSLASLANYNMGNLSFKSEKYDEAIKYYEQALRLNPGDDSARHNLRVAQKKKEQKDKDKKDNDSDQKEDKKDDKKNDQSNNPQDQNQQNNPPKDQEKLNPQAADQILNAVDTKENATRQRLQNNPNRQINAPTKRKNW